MLSVFIQKKRNSNSSKLSGKHGGWLSHLYIKYSKRIHFIFETDFNEELYVYILRDIISRLLLSLFFLMCSVYNGGILSDINLARYQRNIVTY